MPIKQPSPDDLDALTEGLTPHEKERATAYLMAVGHTANLWSTLEMIIDRCAVELAKIESPLAFCFTAQIAGSARKLDAYIAIAKERGAASFAGELESFSKRTAGLSERRNRVIHDPWDVVGPIAKRFEVTARRKLKYGDVPVGPDALPELHNDIHEHTIWLLDLHQKIISAVGS
jgi:hypothetical protein